MPLIKWDEKLLAVGIEFIDNQHKQLINYINELSQAIKHSKESEITEALFEKLYEYTKYHFRTEEEYFFRLNLTDAKLHQLQHKHFIEELNRIKQQKHIESFSSDLLDFLTDWLLSHIQEEDRKFIKKQIP